MCQKKHGNTIFFGHACDNALAFFAVTWIGMGSWACTIVLTFTMVIYIKMIIMQYRSICQSVVVLQYLI